MVVRGEPPGAVSPRHLLILQLQLHPPPAAISLVLVEPEPRLRENGQNRRGCKKGGP